MKAAASAHVSAGGRAVTPDREDGGNATKYVSVRDEAGAEQFLMGTPPHLEDPIWQEDWSLEPFPFKIYESLDPLALPQEVPLLGAARPGGPRPHGRRAVR